jgi:hypothetical protein
MADNEPKIEDDAMTAEAEGNEEARATCTDTHLAAH